MTELLHKTLETKTSLKTEQGEFTAIAACYSVDRVNDRIRRGAFGKTIDAWQNSGKQLPLHWDHQGRPHDVIGSVDPATMAETDAGLYVEGRLDIETSEMAREAWRSMKNNTLSLSFGYLPTKAEKAADGVNDLIELDVFEVSVVPGPCNPDTRFLSLKSQSQADPKALRKRTFDAALESAKQGPSKRKAQEPEPEEEVEETDEPQNLDEAKVRGLINEVLAERVPEQTEDAKSLRKRTFDAALERAKEGRPTRKTVTPAEPVEDEDEQATDESEVDVDETKIRAIVNEEVTKQVSEVEDGRDEELPVAKAITEDPLRKRTYEAALGISNGGMRVRKHIEPDPEPEEPLDAVELRRRTDRLRLDIASG